MSLRTFTKALGRYKVGAQHDYPRDVWNRIARDANMKLDSFSTEVTAPSPLHQSALKGKPNIHRRLGATQ